MATARDVLDLPAPDGPSTAMTSLTPSSPPAACVISVSSPVSLSRPAEMFTHAMLPAAGTCLVANPGRITG